MKKQLGVILKYSLFFGVGALFIWLSLKNLDAQKAVQVRRAFAGVNTGFFIPVFFILVASHYLRAIRWRLLIQSLGYTPTRANTFFAVMIGYLVNQAVPRLGEVVKCSVLSRYEKIPVEKLIGTIILERLIDALTLLIIFGITLAIQPDLYSQIISTFFETKSDGSTTTWAKNIPLIILGLLLAAIVLWMIVKKKRISDLLTAFQNIIGRVWSGISAVRHLKSKKRFIVYTFLLWGLYLLGGYIGFLAFTETKHYGIKEAFSILSAGSIGMVASPGGIGAYALLIDKTMQLYGLGAATALAFGWILWLVQTAVILFGGLVSFVALPFLNKSR